MSAPAVSSFAHVDDFEKPPLAEMCWPGASLYGCRITGDVDAGPN